MVKKAAATGFLLRLINRLRDVVDKFLRLQLLTLF